MTKNGDLIANPADPARQDEAWVGAIGVER
jgi:hypothetical protein